MILVILLCAVLCVCACVCVCVLMSLFMCADFHIALCVVNITVDLKMFKIMCACGKNSLCVL